MEKGFQLNDDFPSRKEVIERIEAGLQLKPEKEIISIYDGLGRVLAEDQYSLNTMPFYRSSVLDGIAVKSEDFQAGIPDTSDWIYGKDFIRADTGDDFDDEFDAVIRMEKVTIKDGKLVEIADDVEVFPGAGVKAAGKMIKRGGLVLKGKSKLRAVDLSALAMGGITEIPVYRKPSVAFIPTGSELIEPGIEVTRGKTVDSNSILAENLLREMGAEPVMFPIVKDDKNDLERVLDEAMAEADIVIINGGSSLGEEDFNAKLLEKRGDVVAHGVAAAPGKPMCAAFIDGKPVINLPGPPIGLFYGMDWCIRKIVCRLLEIPLPRRKKIKGILTEDINTPYGIEILCMIRAVKHDDGTYEVAQVPFKERPMPEALCANAVFISDPATTGNRAGEYIEVELIQGEEFF